MSDPERILSEDEINTALDKIINNEGVFENPSHLIRLLAKLIYNLRVDLDELREELIKQFKQIQSELEEVVEDEYYPESEDDLRKLDSNPGGRFFNDFYA